MRLQYPTALAAFAAMALVSACQDSAGVLAPEPAEAIAPTAADAFVESVTGSAHTFGDLNGVPYPRNLEFNARRAADGAVSGGFQLLTGIVQWRGPVTCFEIVSETQVRIGGLAAQIIDPKGTVFGGPPPQGVLEVFAIVNDNGEGAGDPADTSTPVVIGGPGTAALGCAGGFDGTPSMELSSGNVQIHR